MPVLSNGAQALLVFLAAAFVQNLVLTTGIGSALTIRVTRRNESRLVFALCLLLISVLTTFSFHPIDPLLPNDTVAGFFRPLVIVALSAVWYLLLALGFKALLPRVYEDVRGMLPFAAINTIVTGVTLIAPHQFGDSLLVALGVAAGAAVGFFLVYLLLCEGIDRMQHDEMPKAFAGLPAQFLYLGILALALCGFATDISFI